MITQMIKMNAENIDGGQLKIAAEALRAGKVVAFPTETVYGLGANALSEGAVQKIFEAKGRPSDNPLIVHVANRESVDMLVQEVPPKAVALMDKFWPGPLTLVLKKKDIVPQITTAGLETVGIRMPEHPVALELIRLAGIPVAAPSANVSGKPSPTAAEHVLEDMNGKIEIIIDAGSSAVGLESTVLDVSVEPPVLLRPGGVTPEQIEEVIGFIEIDGTILGRVSENSVPKSPGMKYRHYAPKAHVVIVRSDRLDSQVNKIIELADRSRAEGKQVGICATDQTIHHYSGFDAVSVGNRENPKTIASNLFGLFRDFDAKGTEIILAESVDINGVGLAIMNRMVKAAGYDVVETD